MVAKKPRKPKPPIDAGPRLAEMIAGKLRAGIVHPGDPSRDMPSRIIALPAFRPSAGMPAEMSQLVEESTRQISEAIIHAIRTEGDIALVPNSELNRYVAMEKRQGGAQDFSQVVPVHCRCDAALADPLMVLTITDEPHIVIDGRQLLQGLAHRTINHPHTPRIEK